MKSSFQDNALGMFLSNFLKWFTFTFDRFDATTAGIATKDWGSSGNSSSKRDQQLVFLQWELDKPFTPNTDITSSMYLKFL